MSSIIKGSKIISLLIKIVTIFASAYSTSVLKRFFDFWLVTFRNSVTRRILSGYVYKKPWFRYSLSYRAVMSVVGVVDRVMDFIYRLWKKLVYGSVIAESFKKANAMSISDKCMAAGALLVSIPVGSMIAAIVFGNCSIINIVMSWAVFIGGVMIVIVAVYGRNSIIAKIVRWIISALK